MNIATESRVERVHANGQPSSLLDIVLHEALAYRQWGTVEGDFLADQMDRLAQLVRWTGASTPQEHLDRMEVWDAEIAESHFDRGFSEGRASRQLA